MTPFVQTLLIVSALAIFPAFFIYDVARRRKGSAAQWAVKVLYTGVFLLFVYVVGPWDWLSVHLRIIWIALYVVVVAAAWIRGRKAPGAAGATPLWGEVVTLVFFSGLLLFALRGYFYSDEPVHLTFPLQDGAYYVGQGGNSPLINYHNTYGPQRYAIDIVALNPLGARAAGLYPSDLDAYAIYGATVYSPCNGTVSRSVDGLPDLLPGDSDTANVAGNHVVIACEGVNVVLAHLMRGSVAVDAGSEVYSGQAIAKVGNSGNTSEPHLHVHAVRAGQPDAIVGESVPILFEGRFPVRNAVFRR